MKGFFTSVLYGLLILLLMAMPYALKAQRIDLEGVTKKTSTTTTQSQTLDAQGRPINKALKDSGLQHRDNANDTITIFYKYFDSSRTQSFDSSINDFTKHFPVPYTYNTLSNYGNAAQSLIFSPILRAGFDVGFHAFDVYRFRVEDTKFYTTTRPYSQLGYLLGSKAEQTIHVLHTQNKKSNFNFALEYRFINTPGAFVNQNTSHNNIRANFVYQSPNTKYHAYFIYISNKLKSSENGGLKDPAQLGTLAFSNPFEIAVRMGNYASSNRNPFSTKINTGNVYNENTFLLRQQYDLGKKDSLVTDSVTYRYFYPRLRLQHTVRYSSYSYSFVDLYADSISYKQYFNFPLPTKTSAISFVDEWKELHNEFSLITFPEKQNQNQFLKLGAAIQNIKSNISAGTDNYYNAILLAEYRNRTKNKVWDIIATGQFYAAGFHAGNYQALVSLKRALGKKAGYLELGFQNVNRSPSMLYEGITSFPIKNAFGFKKENTTRLFAAYELPKQQLKISGEYYLVSNYSYFDSMFTVKQEGTLFNLLHVKVEKKIKLSKRWNWYTEVHLQQYTGNPPIRVPFLLTRNRIAYEGNFFQNLFLSTGVEIKANTNYKADNYSPIMGQFFFQDNFTVTNRAEVDAFLNFRIKTFKAYVRAENLNTLLKGKSGSYSHYNISRENYVYPGFWFRLGIVWSFVN